MQNDKPNLYHWQLIPKLQSNTIFSPMQIILQWLQITFNSQNVTVGPEDFHPRDAEDLADAEAQLHAAVFVGSAAGPEREDQPHR